MEAQMYGKIGCFKTGSSYPLIHYPDSQSPAVKHYILRLLEFTLQNSSIAEDIPPSLFLHFTIEAV